MRKKLVILILLMSGTLLISGSHTYIHHDLKVILQPELQELQVIDTIHFPASQLKDRIHFLLHGNLVIDTPSTDIQIKKEDGELKSDFFGINTAQFEIKKEIPINHYSIKWLAAQSSNSEERSFTIRYSGKIHHPVKQVGAEYARGFSETPGIISAEGVFLSGSTFWIPWFNDDIVTFKMETQSPETWETVSEGDRIQHDKEKGIRITTWDSPQPMEEVHLIAAPFTEYTLKVGKVNVMAFLRSNDESLANKYLETTGQYMEMYEQLIGPYPFSKFALIENFWETGYGMSSFTLLGPKVIRFPFILHSSYPHELLHNWWGNSVFVDYDAGNWCEGITAYLADHLIKEQRGEGQDYRKTTLQDYTHYAAEKKEEFPLTQFKSRYNSLSSSIGYGKSLMLYHMLRYNIGDSLYKKILQHFYKENKYKKATFTDFKHSVEAITGKDYTDYFQQWVTRTGIPEIRLSHAEAQKQENKWVINCSLQQLQQAEPYNIIIPAAITLEGQKTAEIKQLKLTKKQEDFQLIFSKQPLRIDLDPEFDVMRKLHINEIPPTLSSIFGAQQILILIPSGAPPQLQQAYSELAERWAKESEGNITVQLDNQVKDLPSDRSIWIFGWENLHKNYLSKGITFYSAELTSTSVTIDKKELFPESNSIVVATKNNTNQGQVVVLLSSDQAAAIPGLGRKLPHYGKYSYLGFEGDEPTNMLKGQWPVVNSPLSAMLIPQNNSQSKKITAGELPKREALGRLAPLFSKQRMMEHLRYLASEELEGRGLGSKGLEKAAHYIANSFKKAGLEPGGDNHSYFQTWEAEAIIGRSKQITSLRNIIGIIPGKAHSLVNQPVILCAHYDHLGLGWPDVHAGNEGKIHYGADDNASGVSIMLELVETLGKTWKPERPIIFIAFSGEESGLMGSSHYLNSIDKNKIKNIMAVVNLDTVGRLSDDKKLMIIGGSSAREWRFIFMGIGYTTGIEAELIPQELDASDHVNFIKVGIPGIQLFSGPHQDYHRPTDTIEKIDANGLVKVATVARETLVYLAERKEPLTFQGTASTTSNKPPSMGTSRRVGTGVMPDFSFPGPGVKIAIVSPGSAAENSGLKKGDIIIKLGETTVTNLKEYSNTLKSYNPGDSAQLVYQREGKEHSTTITFSER